MACVGQCWGEGGGGREGERGGRGEGGREGGGEREGERGGSGEGGRNSQYFPTPNSGTSHLQDDEILALSNDTIATITSPLGILHDNCSSRHSYLGSSNFLVTLQR